MFRIPLFDLNYDERETQAVVETLESKWISMGPRAQALEARFADMLGVKHAVALNSCTAALHLACLLAGLWPGDEAICPSLTFAATANAIRYTGATPVFADIRSHADLTLDPESVRRCVTPRTKAVMVMHYGGFPCDLDAIGALCDERGLVLLEDACHGPLSEHRGRKLGTFGRMGCFSFFSNKNISTGEGGMLTTDDDALDARARLLRSHGMTTMSYQRAQGHATAYDILELGYNYRMDDIHAALGLAQLDKLPGDLAARARHRAQYERRLLAMEGITVPFAGHGEFCSNYILPVVLERGDAADRDAVRETMAARGVQTSVHYPAVHRFSIYQGGSRPMPQTEYAVDHELTLPMYARLTEQDVDDVCDALAEALRERFA